MSDGMKATALGFGAVFLDGCATVAAMSANPWLAVPIFIGGVGMGVVFIASAP